MRHCAMRDASCSFAREVVCNPAPKYKPSPNYDSNRAQLKRYIGTRLLKSAAWRVRAQRIDLRTRTVGHPTGEIASWALPTDAVKKQASHCKCSICPTSSADHLTYEHQSEHQCQHYHAPLSKPCECAHVYGGASFYVPYNPLLLLCCLRRCVRQS